MIIRTAVENDVKQVAEIDLACGLGNWTESDYRSELQRDDSLLLIAAVQKTVIGFLSARLNNSTAAASDSACAENLESSDDFEAANCFAEGDIINFGVLERYRKSGVATALLSELKRRALRSRVRSIWLEVRQSNEVAVRFYRKNGFFDVQIRRGFYTNPSDNAIIMKLNLPSTF